ncbi:hypothetical protein FI667_g749, partial [Globisporangium splendens]
MTNQVLSDGSCLGNWTGDETDVSLPPGLQIFLQAFKSSFLPPSREIASSGTSVCAVFEGLFGTAPSYVNGYSLSHHPATVDGLMLHAKYCYKVNSLASADLQSWVYTFKTARGAQDASEFKMVGYGDGVDAVNSVGT